MYMSEYWCRDLGPHFCRYVDEGITVPPPLMKFNLILKAALVRSRLADKPALLLGKLSRPVFPLVPPFPVAVPLFPGGHAVALSAPFPEPEPRPCFLPQGTHNLGLREVRA